MASPTAQSSGLLAAGTYTIFAGKGTLNGILADVGATITAYDNPSAGSGSVVTKAVNAGTSTLDHMFNVAVRFDTGLTVVVSGGNAIVYWGGN